MKLTKRQLKRIVNEEYSRLKQRGLLNEAPVNDGDIFDMAQECLEVQPAMMIRMCLEICEANKMMDNAAYELCACAYLKDTQRCEDCLRDICSCPQCREICMLSLIG